MTEHPSCDPAVGEQVAARLAAGGLMPPDVRQITAAQFRALIGASRKLSIGLLTYLDRTGFTLRIGDVRKVRG